MSLRVWSASRRDGRDEAGVDLVPAARLLRGGGVRGREDLEGPLPGIRTFGSGQAASVAVARRYEGLWGCSAHPRAVRTARQSADLPPGYPQEYQRLVTLSDGRSVLIRPIQPSDAPMLAEAIESADADTIYRRFFGGRPRVTPELLDHLTTVN